MTTYAFETITAEQALAIQVGDYLTIEGGPASRVSVLYSPAGLPIPDRIEVTVGGRTVVFGPELADLSQRGALEMGDGSRLRIGDGGSDVLTGGDGHDGLFGGGGDDVLRGLAGDDFLHGNVGDDTLYGGEGVNTIHGGRGDDVIYVSSYGETRGSWAHGNLGDDEVIGGAGSDTLLGGQGDDFIGGKEGDDILFGDLGDDEIHAGDGHDLVIGGAGDDKIYSNGGADLIFGQDGDDLIVIYGFGLASADGGAGNDHILSAGQDRANLTGGEGRDVFEFIAKRGPEDGFDDLIADWNGADDKISFAQVSIYSILPTSYSEFVADDYAQALSIANEHITFTGAKYVAAQIDGDVVVFADADGDPSNGADIAVLLVGKSLADISLANFI